MDLFSRVMMAEWEYDETQLLVQKAFNYASKLAPPHITIEILNLYVPLNEEEYPPNDRIKVIFNHEIFIVTCHLHFDFRDRSFPPDIQLLSPPELLNMVPKDTWLPPHDWDINQESCLITWLQAIWINICYCASKITKSVKSTQRAKFHTRAFDEYEEEKSNSDYTDAMSAHSMDEMDEMVDNKYSDNEYFIQISYEIRKSIIQEWLSAFEDNLIMADIDDYLFISLYVSVEIPPDMLQKMAGYQMDAYESSTQTIAKAREDAPVIVKGKT
ncbi:hypothetical protein CLU79DRAFT_508157 [Phycomyces nitens]|nr:hypothetical protein CLU79DRAFT_508157 [Phycomyces nitens]